MPRKVDARRPRKPYKRQLTVEEIAAHPLYAQLTEGQGRFVLVYLETKSVAEAVTAGYPNTSPGSLRAAASKLFRDRLVSKLLAMALDYSLDVGPLNRRELAAICADRLRTGVRSDANFLRILSAYVFLEKICKEKEIAVFGFRQHIRTKPKLKTIEETVRSMERKGKAAKAKGATAGRGGDEK